MPYNRHVSRATFGELVKPLLGRKVTRVWTGHLATVFLELGRLRRYRRGKVESLKGQASVMIEWEWRVESQRAIRFGAASSTRRMESQLQTLVGRRVLGMTTRGRLPELSVELSGGLWMNSFALAERQPSWAVFLTDGSWLCVERGTLRHQSS